MPQVQVPVPAQTVQMERRSEKLPGQRAHPDNPSSVPACLALHDMLPIVKYVLGGPPTL